MQQEDKRGEVVQIKPQGSYWRVSAIPFMGLPLTFPSVVEWRIIGQSRHAAETSTRVAGTKFQEYALTVCWWEREPGNSDMSKSTAGESWRRARSSESSYPTDFITSFFFWTSIIAESTSYLLLTSFLKAYSTLFSEFILIYQPTMLSGNISSFA